MGDAGLEPAERVRSVLAAQDRAGRDHVERVENQLGFKHIKWISEIEFVSDFRNYGEGHGGYNEDHKFYGYRDAIRNYT